MSDPRPERLSNHFEIYGHRGSPRLVAENTLPSFEEALRAGADGFETDLRVLAGGTPVLYHDDELGGDEIETLTAAEVANRGAFVEKVSGLARFAGRCTMILEVKRRGWEETLVRTVGAWPRIVVSSFDHTLIADLARRNSGFPLGLVLDSYLVDCAGYARRIGASWIFPRYRRVDAPMVQSLHAAGIRVVPWSPNESRSWARLRALGCDGVITDQPADAVEWRNSL